MRLSSRTTGSDRDASDCALLALKPKRRSSALLGPLTVVLLRALRLLDPDRTARFTGRVMRRIGPWLKEHRIGRDNLRRGISREELSRDRRILDKVWENLGMFGGEFAHLDRIWDYNEANPAAGRIELEPSRSSVSSSCATTARAR